MTSSPTAIATRTATATPTPSVTTTPTATLALPSPTATAFAYPYPPLPTPACADDYEPDNYPSNANSIVPDAPAQSHTFHVNRDRDWSYFDAVAGQTYVVETLQVADRVIPELYLYAQDGTVLASDTSSGGPTSGRLMWTATFSGRVLLLVRAFETSAYGCGGTYQLRVTIETGG